MKPGNREDGGCAAAYKTSNKQAAQMSNQH